MVINVGVEVAGSWMSDDDGTRCQPGWVFLLDGVCIFVWIARSVGVPYHSEHVVTVYTHFAHINQTTLFFFLSESRFFGVGENKIKVFLDPKTCKRVS